MVRRVRESESYEMGDGMILCKTLNGAAQVRPGHDHDQARPQRYGTYGSVPSKCRCLLLVAVGCGGMYLYLFVFVFVWRQCMATVYGHSVEDMTSRILTCISVVVSASHPVEMLQVLQGQMQETETISSPALCIICTLGLYCRIIPCTGEYTVYCRI